MVKIVKYDDGISGVISTALAITPDISEISQYDDLTPEKNLFNNYIKSTKSKDAESLFIGIYKAKIRTNFLSIKEFLDKNSSAVFVGSEPIVLNVVEDLVKRINPSLLLLPEKQVTVEEYFKKELPPLPTGKECLLYEQHTIVETPDGERGELLICDKRDIGYVCSVKFEKEEKRVFLASQLKIVEFNEETVKTRVKLFKLWRPKYYR